MPQTPRGLSAPPDMISPRLRFLTYGALQLPLIFETGPPWLSRSRPREPLGEPERVIQ